MDTVRWVTLFYASPGLADETEDVLRDICETMARQELERQGYRAGAVTVVDWEFAKLTTPGVLGVRTRADVEILERPAAQGIDNLHDRL